MKLQATAPYQDRLREFASDLACGLGKVSAKFVEDGLLGIYRAKSVNLTEVARTLDENIAIHATQKRLSRNLGHRELGRMIAANLLTFAARRVRQDTMLAVHVRDLKKRYARKMQYLLPADESPNSDFSGYRICEIVACKPGTDRYTPIASHLWSSHAPTFVSDSAEIIATIEQVLSATNGRGIIYPHIGVRELNLSATDLIALTGVRALFNVTGSFPELEHSNWIHNKRSVSHSDLVDASKTPYGVTLYKMHPNGVEESVFCEVGSVSAAPADSSGKLGSFMVVRYDSPSLRDLPKIPHTLFSTSPLKNTRAKLVEILVGHASIIATVAANVEHKDAYNLSGFRVLSFERMRTLLTLLQAVTFFDTAVTRRCRVEGTGFSLQPLPGDHPRTFLIPESVNV